MNIYFRLRGCDRKHVGRVQGLFICTGMLLMCCTNPVLSGRMRTTDECSFYYIIIIIIYFFILFLELELDFWCQMNGPGPFCTPYIIFIFFLNQQLQN